MSLQDLSDRLAGKLQLFPVSGVSCTYYKFKTEAGLVTLPFVVTVPGGAGTLRSGELKRIANGLGLTENAIKAMIACDIGRPCVLLCICGRLLMLANDTLTQQGELFRPGVAAMLTSVHYLLAEADAITWQAISVEERGALDRLIEQLAKLELDLEIHSVAQRVIERSRTQ